MNNAGSRAERHDRQIDPLLIGTGAPDAGLRLAEVPMLALARRASAVTFTDFPICMMVNERSLPPLLKSSSIMVGELITDGCGFQPKGFMAAR